MKDNYNLELTDTKTAQTLDNTSVPKKACQGTPWYSMLENDIYCRKFNFIGADVNEREKLIEDGFPDQLDE